nr:dihydrodipicolinate synthase family protein [Pseudaminobacter sp.]
AGLLPSIDVNQIIADLGIPRLPQISSRSNGWRGIILVATTPFSENGSVDYGSIPAFADYLAGPGCEAVLLRGVAAETAYLDPAERHQLVRSFADTARGRFDLIVGLSVTGRAELVEEARAALDAGASAINWRPTPTMAVGELVATLSAIENAGARKIMLQDFDITGPGLPLDSILRAHREVEAFASIKVETNDNLTKSARIAEGVSRPLNLCAGWPVTGMIASLDAGVHGFMPTGLAPLLQHFYRLHHDGDRPRAVELFERLAPLHKFMSESLGQSIAVNKLLRQRESMFVTNLCRHPEAKLDLRKRATAERLVEAALHLQAGINAADIEAC